MQLCCIKFLLMKHLQFNFLFQRINSLNGPFILIAFFPFLSSQFFERRQAGVQFRLDHYFIHVLSNEYDFILSVSKSFVPTCFNILGLLC